MNIRIVTLAVALVGLIGCDRVVVREPEVDDLVGVYTLTSESKVFLKSKKHYDSIPDSRIEIDSNGSLHWISLPDCLFSPFGESSGKFMSFDGRWKIERYFYTFAFRVSMRLIGGTEDVTYAGPTMFLLSGSSTRLELMIGDPDSGVSIQYEKKG